MNEQRNYPFSPILTKTRMSVDGAAQNEYAHLGWTARDQFACHAPAVPDWFQVRPDDGNVVSTPEETDRQRYFMWRWYFADMMLNVGAQG